MEKKTRRTFLWLANAGIVALFLLFWNKLTLNHIELKEQKKKVFLLNKNKSVSFVGDYIIINEKEKFTVLSAHCSHLGCKINLFESNRIICPCHGSEYDLQGNSIKGPAFKSLKKVPAQLSDDGTSIEIIS